MKVATAFPSVRSFPDPASVVTPAQWYLLNHISSSLLQFDHKEGRFEPLLAERWSISDTTYSFVLKKDLKFSDGTPITSADVVASIKRQLKKGTSTHFRVSKYFPNCLKESTGNCEEIVMVDDRTIEFRLPMRLESFLLFLAGPEGAVWSQLDINEKTLELKPSRFSGPYQLKEFGDKVVHLGRNSNSIIMAGFPDAPEVVDIYINGADPLKLFKEGKIDLYMEMTRPFYEKDFLELNLQRTTSSFNTIIYLSRIAGSQREIGSDFVKALWKSDLGSEMIAASSFLPFGSLGALNEQSFLNVLPAASPTGCKVAVPTPFFHEKMTELFHKVASGFMPKISFHAVPMEEIYELYSPNPKNPGGFDFVLTPYVASERFPGIQISFMLDGKDLPLKHELIDSPEVSPERLAEIQGAQKWFLKSQTVIPLVFVRNQTFTTNAIDMGSQPVTDAEVHLWRVRRKQ